MQRRITGCVRTWWQGQSGTPRHFKTVQKVKTWGGYQTVLTPPNNILLRRYTVHERALYFNSTSLYLLSPLQNSPPHTCTLHPTDYEYTLPPPTPSSSSSPPPPSSTMTTGVVSSDVDTKLSRVGAVWIDDIDRLYEVVGEDPATGEVDRDDDGNVCPGWLGRGSYGIVRRRRRRAPLDKEKVFPAVAVKEIRKEPLIKSSEVLVHTLVELSVLKCVQHVGCIRVVDMLHSASTLYIITPLYGTTLYHCIVNDGAFTLPNTAVVVKQLLETLSYLHHQLMIVHRDVKPENILINPSTLSIKLIDFGLAKFIGKPKVPDNITPFSNVAPSPGIAVTPGTCTTAYASLEVIEAMLTNGGGVTGDPATKWNSGRGDLTKVDIYATGVVCYAMLFTCLPFAGTEAAQSKEGLLNLRVAMQKGVKFPPKAQQFPTQYANTFIMALMQSNPASRPTAAEALTHPFLYNVSVPEYPKTPGAGLGGQTTDADVQNSKVDPEATSTVMQQRKVEGVKISAVPHVRAKRGKRGGVKHRKGKDKAAAAAAKGGGVEAEGEGEGEADEAPKAADEGVEDVPEGGAAEGAEVVVPMMHTSPRPLKSQPRASTVDFTALPSPVPIGEEHCGFKVSLDFFVFFFGGKKRHHTKTQQQDGWGSIMQTLVGEELETDAVPSSAPTPCIVPQ